MSNIKIPEKVYVGFQGRRAEDEVPLGFMTPYTDDEAGQKRRDTVDNWAKGYGYQKTFNGVTLENKPMIGFKVGRSIRRSGGWNGSGASYVRIEDPRGFELEITIENLVMCMSDNMLQNGEILAECVWGRTGNRNILLPTNSEPFQEAKTMESAVAAVISLKEVKAGDTIKLLDGTVGVYYGSMIGLQVERYSNPHTLSTTPKRYVMAIKDKTGKVTLNGSASIKPVQVVKAAEKKLTPAEVEAQILAVLAVNPTACTDATHYYGNGVRMWMVGDKYEQVSKDKLILTEDDIKQKGKEFFDNKELFAVHNSGTELEISSYYETNFAAPRTASGREYDYYDEKKGHWGGYTTINTSGIIGRSRYSTYHRGASHIEESDLKEFYVNVVAVKTKTGTEFKTIL